MTMQPRSHDASAAPHPGAPHGAIAAGRARRAWHVLRALAAVALTAALTAALSAGCAQRAPEAPLTIFAAASLKEALDEAVIAYGNESGHAARVSYAASSALARQIEHGAPADVFVSADLDWMDALQAKGLIDSTTRHDLLGNTLVLVAPAGTASPPIALDARTDLRPLLGADGRLALALTASVPAGKYAKAGFESLGLWSALQPHVAESENVRAALLMVARAEAPLGVVYGSDARAEPRVRALATFPASSHPPIVYPVARIATSRHPQSAAFVRWLQTPAAQAIFRARGFTAP